ncbi:MAG TPA: hypothetical protein VFH19_04740 [Nitrososphaeraceae archaeon]|nr:hypothetical protein [Nitrososphaeraceae archaeon]
MVSDNCNKVLDTNSWNKQCHPVCVGRRENLSETLVSGMKRNCIRNTRQATEKF